MTDSVIVLGTRYSIEVKKYEEDPKFKKMDCEGYCSALNKRIVICDTHSIPIFPYELYSEDEHSISMRETLQHEIVHAFFNESGLEQCAGSVSCWAQTEEIVDWIALQGTKIYKAWMESGALEPHCDTDTEQIELFANDEKVITMPVNDPDADE